MVLDSSAIVAILAREPESESMALAIENDPVILVSAATMLETELVLTRWFGDDVEQELDAFVSAATADVVAFDIAQCRIAAQAYRRFGKGRHQASLNYGDCMSYALAKATQEPLLFKGNDFSQTDIVAAKY